MSSSRGKSSTSWINLTTRMTKARIMQRQEASIPTSKMSKTLMTKMRMTTMKKMRMMKWSRKKKESSMISSMNRVFLLVKTFLSMSSSHPEMMEFNRFREYRWLWKEIGKEGSR
jgi:BioD-like phosphotransacetylase family protein